MRGRKTDGAWILCASETRQLPNPIKPIIDATSGDGVGQTGVFRLNKSKGRSNEFKTQEQNKNGSEKGRGDGWHGEEVVGQAVRLI